MRKIVVEMVLTNQFDLLMQFAVKELWRQGGKGQNGMKMDHGLTVIEAWLKTPRSRRRNKDRQGTGTGGVKKKKKNHPTGADEGLTSKIATRSDGNVSSIYLTEPSGKI